MHGHGHDMTETQEQTILINVAFPGILKVMSEHHVLLPSQQPLLTLVKFCERCQAKKKPGTARTDLEKLNDAFRSTEEGRAELFQFYRLLLPEVIVSIASCNDSV